MSIAIAIVANGAAVVATDSQRTESDCTVRYNFGKTFDHNGVLFGAYCGLLEFLDNDVSGHVSALLGSDCGLPNDFVGVLHSGLQARLNAIDPKHVAPKHRGLELLLIPKTTRGTLAIQSLEFRPDQVSRVLKCTTAVFPQWCITGDEAAREPIDRLLRETYRGTESRKELTELARRAVVAGVASCGPHPFCPNLRACGGLPSVRAFVAPVV
jgi:hypothetical protein